MKNIIAFCGLCALLSLAAVPSAAQNGNGLGGGVRAGVNLSDFTGSTGVWRTGLRVGGFADYTIQRFGLELGAFYSEQGAFATVPNTEVSGARIDYRFDYINFNLLAKYQLFSGFRVYLGPQGGYLINSEQSYDQVRQPYDQVNKWDLGITGGVGYTFNFGLDLSAGYTHSLVDLFSSDRYANTTLFSVTVGWHFLNKNRSHRSGGKK